MNTVQCKAMLGQGISGKLVISGFVGDEVPTGPLAAYYKLSLNRVLVVLSSSGFKFFLYADKASELRSKLDFVKRYRDGNIILSDDNMQKKKDDLLKYLKGQGFKDNTESLASLKLVSLTMESEKALQKDLESRTQCTRLPLYAGSGRGECRLALPPFMERLLPSLEPETYRSWAKALAKSRKQ
ncbi:hypothetical protein DVH24_042128 [Malus domestica]|uniref:Uncharacterized protein n=1 Tax=Malus domestica TaxID=3750 RepID=A0A498IQ21_MALDO|nr:hypothetical protein DVH24_042128 [Malus domestica]